MDIFMCEYATGNSVVIELKLFNILGLYNGTKGGSYENYPPHEKLLKLNDELKLESEETLFKRNYKYWCKDGRKYQEVNVRDYLNNGFEQLKRYVNALMSGKANHGDKKIGILDDRITAVEGISYLKGILISSFGSHRILVKETSVVKIDYQYYIK